ncbi:hypothetical protein [Marinifilum flexuosum]|uniref:Uncharacterized protein n=1 Tax=Marinifilum flexuosum TaxID=1117708 RepID=A0A419XB76_9BACT|nr:hypothetical protein [Marinifilum flexuosum]RKE04819.1 hypothetical protein BXY64_1847 [Marinifilum flexuosum]
MNSKQTILVSLGIVILNNLIGHFFAPYGIILTPIVVSILAILICLKNKGLNPILKSLILTSLIAIHDIGIKLFAGGQHDYEGLGFIHGILFIGLIPTFIILITSIVKDKESSILNKIIAILLFPLIIYLHLELFGELGIGRYYWYGWNG